MTHANKFWKEILNVTDPISDSDAKKMKKIINDLRRNGF